MKTALISVYNKEGIVDFAKELSDLGWKIISSGGTAKVLSEAGVKVQDVAELVGGGAILGHRVVTLSREVHAGLLATDSKEDRQELEKLNIPRIDLVCVDLYPLKEEIAKKEATSQSVIEKTDIGGPTILRSAAKGRRIVITDPEDRLKVIRWLKEGEPEREEFITALAAKAEKVVADYSLSSARYHSEGKYEGMIGSEVLECRYGENGYQKPAALFSTESGDPLSLDKFELVAGAAPSYNNLCDVDRLLQTITHIAEGYKINRGKVPKIAASVKHGNPCGAAIGDNEKEVIQKTIKGDLRAIFGGLVMTSFSVTEEIAEELLSYEMPEGQRRLLDGIISPSFDKKAIGMLERKGDKCRFLANPALSDLGIDTSPRLRYVRGGFLRQPNYTFTLDFKSSDLEKNGKVSESQEDDMLLAWAVGSTSNSNTVTLVKDSMLIGNGVGQQDRVGGCQLAVRRAKSAGHDTKGAAAYSDSFFPFVDGPEELAKAGVSAILSSSGSVKDDDVKKFCAKNNIGLYLIPDALGRGFFGH